MLVRITKLTLAGLVAMSLMLIGFKIGASEQSRKPMSQEYPELLDANDLLVLRNPSSYSKVHAQVKAACEVIEFCRVIASLPSSRILSLELSGLEKGTQRRILESCTPGPCNLKLSGSFVADEIYVKSVEAVERLK